MSASRPPYKPPGMPPQPIIAGGVTQGTECAYLPSLRHAYYTLMAGAQTSVVRDGDRWQQFHMGNVRELKIEIRRLEILCESGGRARAVRVGAPHPGHGYPFGTRWPY